MRLGVLVWAILAFVSVADAASPPPLLYQGRLTGAAGAATGNFDFTFTLYDTSGEPVGTALASNIKDNVTVSNGLFHCELNFSPSLFDGSSRWLGIAVRTNGSMLPHVALSPRQPIGTTAYAVRSSIADTVESSGLTALNASALSTGTVPDARLSANVARRDTENTFGGAITVSGEVTSSAGGFRFPDGTVQTTASATPSIIASVNVNFSLDDRSGWTQVTNLGDDTVFLNIPLGFTFNGFGATTTNISFSSNGILFFGNNASISWVNTSLPANISSNPMLFFFWDDLSDNGAGDLAEYTTLGTAGGRVFSLYFKCRLRGNPCSDASGIAALISIHENSNLVKVSYSGITGCPASRASGATIGLQTAGGASATPFMIGFNAQVLDDNSTSQTISFQPGN